MSEQTRTVSGNAAAGEGSREPGPAKKNGLVAKIITNTSLLTALLVYMGWAYENALLTYFNVSPLSLNLSIVDYVLHSLNVFINTFTVLFAVALIVVIALCFRSGHVTGFLKHISKDSHRTAGTVVLITAAACFLLLFGTSQNWNICYPYLFCFVLLLVGAGPLILTWPAGPAGSALPTAGADKPGTRQSEEPSQKPADGTTTPDRPAHQTQPRTTSPVRPDRFLYPIAIVVAAACALWAAYTYATSLGTQQAKEMMNNPSMQPAVYLYSTQPLALSGDGVQVLPVHGSLYHYRYYGLRLLIDQSGTYYLLPVNWNRKQGHTFIFTDSDQIRIELSAH